MKICNNRNYLNKILKKFLLCKIKLPVIKIKLSNWKEKTEL